MKQSELVAAIAAQADLPKATVDKVLTHLGTVTTAELKSGGEVTLPGLGKLSVSDRAARTGRNPQTGAPIEIAASKSAKFGASKALKDALN